MFSAINLELSRFEKHCGIRLYLSCMKLFINGLLHFFSMKLCTRSYLYTHLIRFIFIVKIWFMEHNYEGRYFIRSHTYPNLNFGNLDRDGYSCPCISKRWISLEVRDKRRQKINLI